MKPDGFAMATTEPTEAVLAEPPAQGMEEVEPLPELPTLQPEDSVHAEHPDKPTAPPAAQEDNDKTAAAAAAAAAADTKAKAKGAVTKVRPGTAGLSKTTGPGSRPGTTQSHTVNGVKPSTKDPVNKPPVKKTTTSGVSAPGLAAAKKPHGAAASSSVRSQPKVTDRKPVGPSRTTSAPLTTNGTKAQTGAALTSKRPTAGPVSGTKLKTTAPASRPTASVAPKPSMSTAAKADRTTASRTARPATAPTTSRPAFSNSTVVPAAKPPSTLGSSRPTAPRAGPTAPSTGRTAAAAAAPPKTAGPAKKDVGRPASTAAAKKPATSSAAIKTTKPEPTKPAPSSRPDPASKRPLPTKAAEPKAARSKPLDPPKPAPIRKPPTTRQPLGKTPPASPANRPAGSSTPNAIKRPSKPTQSVQPFTAITKKKPAATEAATAAKAATVVVAAGAAAAAAAASSGSVPEASVTSAENIVLEVAPAPAPEGSTEVSPSQAQLETAVPSPPRSPVQSAAVSSALTAAPSLDPAAPETPGQLLPELATSSEVPFPAATLAHQQLSAPNLNDEEEEEEEEDDDEEDEERVSVSEMSGTQPTEESRPGSASQAGGSAWRASGGALLSELDSEEVSCSQQGASEMSAPGVLEGTESTDDLGDGSLKEAIDMEGASAGTPDFEKVPDIGDEEDEDGDRVCDMDVGSERAEDPRRAGHHHHHHEEEEEEEEDEDVEMASEGVTESGLESYGNADEDDFAEDERLDNLNRGQMLPAPAPVLPSSPAAQWDRPNNPLADPWAQSFLPPQAAAAVPASPSIDPWQADSETPTQSPAQPWLELGSAPFVPQIQEPEPRHRDAQSDQGAWPSSVPPMKTLAPAPPCGLGMSQSSSETSTPEELRDYNTKGKLHTPATQAPVLSLQPDPEDLDLGIHLEKGDGDEEEAEAETLPADEVLGGPATAPTSNPSSSTTTEDEASDMEGEAQLEELPVGRGIDNAGFDRKPADHPCMVALEEAEEAAPENGAGGDSTPPSANSATSYGFFDATASNSHAQSAGESCTRSPGIYSLEELPEEAAKGPGPQEQHYMLCGKTGAEGAEVGVEGGSDPSSLSLASPRCDEEEPDTQPPYYSTICDKTENSLAGLSVLTHPHRRDPSAPRPHCDIPTPPRLTCADLPPRSPRLQVSPQLRRLEQHHKQLLELQQRQDLQGKPTEEEVEERKKEEEERRKKEEERRKEEQRQKKEEQEELERKRRDVLQVQQQQQEELKQRQQIRQWQQELEQQQPQKGQSTVLLSPSSGLCTIYEALENSDSEEEVQEEGMQKLVETDRQRPALRTGACDPSQSVTVSSEVQEDQSSNLKNNSPPPESTPPPSPHRPDINGTPQGGHSPPPPESPERPSPLDLDWGKKADIVQQLINQTLMLTGDGCSSLLLLPGGGGGTLSPLESSLWPNLLAPLTPPSATVTSVSSFSPEAPGSSPQGEWTVVELETHH